MIHISICYLQYFRLSFRCSIAKAGTLPHSPPTAGSRRWTQSSSPPIDFQFPWISLETYLSKIHEHKLARNHSLFIPKTSASSFLPLLCLRLSFCLLSLLCLEWSLLLLLLLLLSSSSSSPLAPIELTTELAPCHKSQVALPRATLEQVFQRFVQSVGSVGNRLEGAASSPRSSRSMQRVRSTSRAND